MEEPIGCYDLVTESKEIDNICVHQLSDDNKLQELLTHFKPDYTKAVVFINTEESYGLSLDFFSSIKEVQFPFVLVKKSDGKNIMKYMEIEGVVCASVLAKEDSTSTNQTTAVDQSEPEPEKPADSSRSSTIQITEGDQSEPEPADATRSSTSQIIEADQSEPEPEKAADATRPIMEHHSNS